MTEIKKNQLQQIEQSGRAAEEKEGRDHAGIIINTDEINDTQIRDADRSGRFLNKLSEMSQAIFQQNEQTLNNFYKDISELSLNEIDNQETYSNKQQKQNNQQLTKEANQSNIKSYEKQKIKQFSTQQFSQEVINKSSDGIMELMSAMKSKQNISPFDIVTSIIQKNQQGVQNIRNAFSEMMAEEDAEIQQTNVTTKKQTKNIEQFSEKILPYEENDNQFISEEFGSHEKLEQIRNYVTSGRNLSEKASQQFNRENKLFNVLSLLEEKYLTILKENFQAIQNVHLIGAAHSIAHPQIPRQMSSRSQRIKSGTDKRSQGSQQFNFDLTMKSKNSKNYFSMIKQDSLMYSAQSDIGFGFRLQSPDKNSRKSNKSKQQAKNTPLQIEDRQEEDDVSSMQEINKAYSQKIESEPQIKDKIEDMDKKSQKSDQVKFSKVEENKVEEKKDQKKKDIEIFTPMQKNNAERERQDTLIPESLSNSEKGQKKQDDKEDDDEQKMNASADMRPSNQRQSQNLVRKRVQTQVRHKKSQSLLRKHKKIFNTKNAISSKQKLHSQSNSNIFSTEISGYQSKIAKIREAKQLKKKKLEEELAKVNSEIKILKDKEQEMSPKSNYASRLDISNNNEAQRKAERLVKNLRSQKRNRNVAKIGEFKSLDRHINDYMDELNKLRAQNEEKYKQKRKLEILERMKQNQMRKISERKKKEQSQQFVLHLRDITKPQLKPSGPPSNLPSKRSPTRNIETEQKEQLQDISMTPELSHKKAYLNKIRSFSIKKSTKDLYEQVLG